MRLPHVRFTVRSLMVAVCVVSLLMAIMIHLVRNQRLKSMATNQEITLRVAEVNVLNAALAYDNAASAIDEYVKKNDKNMAKDLPLETSAKEHGGVQTLDSLQRQVERTLAMRRYKKAVWGYERLKLKRLKWELEHFWSFWPRGGTFASGESQRRWKLSEQEAAEIDMRLKHFGMTAID